MSPARPATARDRTTSSWARKQGDWKALDATKGLVLALDERKGVTWAPVADTGNARRSAPRASTREIDTCARCHGRAARISDDYVHGKSPLDTHRLTLSKRTSSGTTGKCATRSTTGARSRKARCTRGRHLLRLPRSAFAQAQGAGQRGVRAMPSAGEVRSARAHASRRGNARRCVHRVPHADHDLHGRRSAPRSFDADSASRSVGDAGRAECLQQLSHEADGAVGGRCHCQVDRQGSGRIPAVCRGVAGRIARAHPEHAVRC